MKFRKKPVVIDAIQWDGNDNEVIDFITAEDVDRDVTINFAPGGAIEEITVHTLEGDHHVSYGDFIIKGVKGEVYACKPDIFEMTYEVA